MAKTKILVIEDDRVLAEVEDFSSVRQTAGVRALQDADEVVQRTAAEALGVPSDLDSGSGLEAVDALMHAGALSDYHLLPSVRGDLLVKLNRRSEAKAEFEKAAGMTHNARERLLLMQRAAACSSPDPTL